MEIRVEELTPGRAREIVAASRLEGYGHRAKIEQYKAWMREGKWSLFYSGTAPRLINDPLIFRPNGRLLEGKHRVIALAELEGDLRVPFWVLRDFTAVEAFAQWIDDWEAGRMPKADWKPASRPPQPGSTSSGESSG